MEIKAVFVDAAGTLLRTRQPVGVTYARFARKHGIAADPILVEARFRQAFRENAGQPQSGDGRSFWRPVVFASLDVEKEEVFEELYQWYANPKAWWVDTEALRVLGALARQGLRLGIISNWDTRLRLLYARFALDRMFSILACSGELEVEKPDPEIFRIACRCAGIRPREAIHVGDNRLTDLEGATDAGLWGLLYEEDAGWRSVGERIATLRRMPMFGR